MQKGRAMNAQLIYQREAPSYETQHPGNYFLFLVNRQLHLTSGNACGPGRSFINEIYANAIIFRVKLEVCFLNKVCKI